MFRTGARWPGLRYDKAVAVTETLRTVLDAGGASRRLDELSTARVILKIAEQMHAAQQKAGAGKAIGPVTPAGVSIETATGAVKLGLAEPTAFAYASPEQLGGGDGDRRSDVWSLGVVMWEALTHQSLFEGGDDGAIKAAVKQQIVDPPATLNANIPAELSAICMRALARNPADRYQSAKVMGAELEAVLDDAGYGDSDDKLREYMATLGQPKREPKLSAPPMTVTPAQGLGVAETLAPPADMLTPPPGPPSSTSPGVVIPRGDAAPAPKATQAPITVPARAVGTTPPADKPIETATDKLIDKAIAKPITEKPSDRISRPSILDQEPSKPPASMVAASPGSLETNVEGLSPTSFLKSSPPSAAPASPGANLAAALASAGTQGAPAPVAKPAPERAGFQTLQSAAAPMPASAISASPTTVPMAPVLPKATSSGTTLGFSSAAEAAAHEAPPIKAAAIDTPHQPAPATPVVKRDPTPAPRKRAPTNPDPAAVVALPKAGRESAEVLGGWGWGTDSHPAIKPYDPDDDAIVQPGPNKRLLFYVFGGGFAVVAIILIVVFAFGGAKPADDKLAAQTGSGSGSGSAEIAYGSGVEYGKATGDPTGGSAAIAAGSDLGSAGSADSAGSAGSAVADTGSAMIATPGSDVGSNTVAVNPPPAVVDAAIANIPPPDAAPVAKKIPEPVKPKQPDKVAVAPPPPHHTDKHVDKRPDKHVDRPPPSHIADPFATQHPPAEPKADAEAAYRQGLQMFARGDTSAALTQLRSSIAANPDYAPAWRGLGLVFEKMGEKDQARSAFKRYLKLAPAANDADQIRNRMERLGS
jgi:serine/threonine-protein kinase